MLPRGRTAQYTPIRLSSGELAIHQPTINGWETSYDPDMNSWCIHAPDGRVIRRFSITTPSGWRNVVDFCKRTLPMQDCH